MARPLLHIKWDDIDKLCQIQATEEEISQFLGISIDTLVRACKRDKGVNFAEYFKQKRGTGKLSLRRYQWQLAQKGNPTMLIWLGKQVLNQRDRQTHEHSGPDGKPIETNHRYTDLTDQQLDERIKKFAERKE